MLAAFSSAASTIAGNLMGAGKSEGVPETTRKTFIFASAFLVPALVLVAAFPSATLRIYTDDAGIIADARASLWVIVAVCWVADHVYWLVMLAGCAVYFRRADWRAVKV